jgi:hypothetical protein
VPQVLRYEVFWEIGTMAAPAWRWRAAACGLSVRRGGVASNDRRLCSGAAGQIGAMSGETGHDDAAMAVRQLAAAGGHGGTQCWCWAAGRAQLQHGGFTQLRRVTRIEALE